MNTASKYHATNEQMDAEFKLIEAAKQDINRFGPLYDKYYKQIFNYLYQRLEDKETAFDLTSQVFLKAMTNLPKYQFKGVPFANFNHHPAQFKALLTNYTFALHYTGMRWHGRLEVYVFVKGTMNHSCLTDLLFLI